MIADGGGVALFDSMGNACTADYLKVTGDLAVDLRSNIAAESRAHLTIRSLEATSPVDSTPVGQWTNDAGEKQKALNERKGKDAAKHATVEV